MATKSAKLPKADKPAPPKFPKLTIQNEMAQFDKKNRNFFKELTDEERKQFSNYIMIRWGSSVEGSREFQEFYLIATNERLNKHFFSISKFPELQWLCATTVSPGMGNQRHNWIPNKKKEADPSDKVKKALINLYPNMKMDEIELLATMTTMKEINELARENGED